MTATNPLSQNPGPDPANPALSTLWLIGDSTVHNDAPGILGWGDVINRYFDTSRINVTNHAIAGRSTRTFMTDGRWDRLLELAKPGDFLLIQFGHNDSSPIDDDSRSRGTLPGVDDEEVDIFNQVRKVNETVHTYGWYLRKFLAGAKAAGIDATVCSYVPRCPKFGTTIETNPAPTQHRLWAQQVANWLGRPYIDLFALVWAAYAESTPEVVKEKFFVEADFTHNNPAGAELNAAKVVEGIRSLKDHPLHGYLKQSVIG